ncbi:hypothetical protein [Butyrivibrio sp. VCB2006]|uniref:hypothetical protein n=1 Tax=Butyrivibrio sp. VCB2006 TaxID=1280679 RepID=UPI0003F534AC|nr:hypothetical protein [Butyrivibrio sp. VCB2006]
MGTNQNTKLFSALSYIGWIGWVISFVLRDKEDEIVKFHLNQSMVLHIAAIIIGVLARLHGIFVVIAGLGGLALFFYIVFGIVRAIQLSTEPLPLIGDIRLVK